MTTHIFEAMYLGVYADLDFYELDQTTDLAASMVGTVFGSAGAPAYLSLVDITMTDNNGDGTSVENDLLAFADSVTMGGVARAIDSVTDYAVTVTFADGTTATTELELLQDTSGRLFIVPYQQGSPLNAVLDDGPIVSIRFDAVVGSTFYGTVANPEPDAFVTCFAAGTMIDTPEGPIDVARLGAGDSVLTVDAGPADVVLATRICGDRQGRGAPVRIAAGALGPNVPFRDVEVSRQHRVLVASPIAARIFGSAEVLVRAVDLLGVPGIALAPGQGSVTYLHVMTARHDLLVSHGMVSESLWPGKVALGHMSPLQRRIARQYYPSVEGVVLAPPARPLVQGPGCRALVRRHLQNGKPLQPARG
ncbi:hypothetical protein BOO69_12870 [Sulfitobacter alexandrii]|uniref:Hedgehog/Intein (Hint) domain-containing protein n=1 Tax=Sulfitobacter alexandrii TaxID=1917485 RepID=A0A1J0WJ44_9RHOB|nr:Hint domain-containing protein [Sulfitobacter alexandrii]APE44192.1 hypothetical protein BOO69_12870 [Sulfitobacter alexandrii]